MKEQVGFVPSDALLDELDECILILGRLFASRHGELSETAPLSGPRLIVLRLLSELGSAKTGEIAGHLGIKAPATTSLIDSLERDRLVKRHHRCCDRRVTLVEVTAKGKSALAEAEVQRREHMRRYLAGLTEDDIRQLIRIHGSIISAMSSGS